MFGHTPTKYRILTSLISVAILYMVFIANKFDIVHKNPVSANQEEVPNYDFQNANGNEISIGEPNNENKVPDYDVLSANETENDSGEQNKENKVPDYDVQRTNGNEIGSEGQNNKSEVSIQNEQRQKNGNAKTDQNDEKTQPQLQEVEKEEGMGEEWKTILFYSSWFGQPWFKRYNHPSAEELKMAGCPSWRCNFTTNRADAKSADAIVFSSTMVSNNNIPSFRLPEQRWVWVNVEAPKASPAQVANHLLRKNHLESHFNWTMTYHLNADIVAFYGYFISKGEKAMPLRPNLMSEHPKAMKKYTESLKMNATLEDIMGPSWKDFVRRPKLVAWMSGHCGTSSKREEYVNEVAKYVPLDKYGRCGTKPCQPVLNDGCWKDILGPGYLFYMSFENALCNEYITEKLYFALKYNLVPIVWGGSDYSRFLPPGSYINGRHYHPKDLASLLLRLQSDPVAYGRYHVWRGFWTAYKGGSMCELCHKLHTDKDTKYQDIPAWRKQTDKCIDGPRGMFNNDDWKRVITPQNPGTS